MACTRERNSKNVVGAEIDIAIYRPIARLGSHDAVRPGLARQDHLGIRQAGWSRRLFLNVANGEHLQPPARVQISQGGSQRRTTDHTAAQSDRHVDRLRRSGGTVCCVPESRCCLRHRFHCTRHLTGLVQVPDFGSRFWVYQTLIAGIRCWGLPASDKGSPYPCGELTNVNALDDNPFGTTNPPQRDSGSNSADYDAHVITRSLPLVVLASGVRARMSCAGTMISRPAFF